MTLPNCLTALRLIISPLLFPAFSSSDLVWVIVIWATAAVTDILDGWAARKRNEVSELGKILDPVADKLIVGFSLIGLIIWYDLPVWLGIAYIIKELVQLLGGIFIILKKARIRASNFWGKAGTTVFFTGFVTYLVYPRWGIWVLIVGLILSVIALITYARAEKEGNEVKSESISA